MKQYINSFNFNYRMIIPYILLCAVLFSAISALSAYALPVENTGPPGKLQLETKGLVLDGIPFTLEIKALDEKGRPALNYQGQVILSCEKGSLMRLVNNRPEPLGRIEGFTDGVLTVKDVVVKDGRGVNVIRAYSELHSGEIAFRTIPGILSVVPPLLAIILALAAKQVIVAIFFGVYLGSIIIYGYNPFIGLMRTLDTILVNAVASKSHASILIFDVFLAGMVAIVAKSGGSTGMVKEIKKWAKSPRTGQLATWMMGLLIFFDDYANTLIVGNSMRPLTDKLKISREKLSFIVDATAAPVTNVALISTWIGFEIGVIGDSLKNIGLAREPYMVFIQTIPYRFYPILMIVFVFLVAWMMKDFGPMLKAEKRAAETGQVLSPDAKPLMNIQEDSLEKEGVPERWYNGVIPIATVVFGTMWGLWYSGTRGILEKGGAEALKQANLFSILNNANSFQALLWASFMGILVTAVLVLSQKILTIEEILGTWVEGAKSIIPALVILVLAWSIGDICQTLNTGNYVAEVARGNVSPHLLPVIIFTLSAVISFATGTSWGTMSIVMPIAVYVGYYLPPASMAPAMKESILLGTLSGVLAGATFGDHCSPISDTTIMSSMSSGADHIDHVRTQMPYALTVGAVALFIGTIPAGFGLNPWVSMTVGIIALIAILKIFGKNPAESVEIPGEALSEPQPDIPG